jgi:phosphate transport system substrate-binding protein
MRIRRLISLFKLRNVVALAVTVVIGGAALAACTSGPTAITGAGSDTTYWMMAGSDSVQGTPPPHPVQGVTDKYNGSQTANKTTEIPPVLTAPFPGPSFSTPGDSKCAAQTYDASNPPPNGSGKGITALVNDTAGCIDYARSSRGPASTDPSSLKFWAYALDALTWIKFPQNTHGVTNLSAAQLKNIYTCNPATHAPYASNWNQVGGTSAGVIKKYAPQTGSGTYSFVNSKLLGGATIDQNCDSAHLSTFLQEHDATGIPAAQKPNAIYFFSVAQVKAQSNGSLPDLRNGSTLGAINGVTPSGATINTTASRFFGTRYIYNVTKTGSPSESATLDFVGVKAAGPGYLCNNSAMGNIQAFGGVPLGLGGTGAGLPNSYCRLNPTPL